MKTWLEQHEEFGYARGYARGLLLVRRESVLLVLGARIGHIPPEVAERVNQIDDHARLTALLERAFSATSLADLGLA
jgi:hypothetical protein